MHRDARRVTDYVDEVGGKVLRQAETLTGRSRQHELQGVNQFIPVFGVPFEGEKIYRDARFIYLSDSLEETVEDTGRLSFYDSRWKKDRRSKEYRIYYPTVGPMLAAKTGDFCFLIKPKKGSLIVVVAAQGSTAAAQLDWIFGTGLVSLEAKADIQEIVGPFAEGVVPDVDVGFIELSMLERLGIDIEFDSDFFLGRILDRFGPSFPSTKEFSAYSRSTVRSGPLKHDPDRLLLAWVNREELLFRTLERHLLVDVLSRGFESGGRVDVDDFISVSLSVQNRRKSRAGRSLEHHVQALLKSRRIGHSFNEVTEGKSKPDFIFPNIASYRNIEFPANDLTMLGVKSTCKDRWRQVLSEADRVKRKHLLTLESPVSLAQTTEMSRRELHLVVPGTLHDRFQSAQRAQLMTVASFLELVQNRTP